MKKCNTLHFRLTIELLPNNTVFSEFILHNKNIFRELLLKHTELYGVNIKLYSTVNYYQ